MRSRVTLTAHEFCCPADGEYKESYEVPVYALCNAMTQSSMHSVECQGLQVAFIVLSLYMHAVQMCRWATSQPTACAITPIVCATTPIACATTPIAVVYIALAMGVHMTCSFLLIDLETPTNIHCNSIFTLLDLSQLLHVGGTFYSLIVEDVFSVCC